MRKTNFIILFALLSCNGNQKNINSIEPNETSSKILDPKVFRTDFSSEERWNTLCEEVIAPDPQYGFEAHVEFVNEEEFKNIDPKKIRAKLSEKYEEYFNFYFVADSITFNSPDLPILCIKIPDRYSPGEDSLRIIPSQIWSIESNLRISNMDFNEFSNAVDSDGVFRGF